MSKQIFVFVVCGATEHIETLHLSLAYLKKYSQKEIWVLTDSSRNELPINHQHVIDVKTPVAYNHHQASIYLKTGIHLFLPKGNTYCYLDTDVVAVSPTCDAIFNEFIPPIRFAPDHCKVRKFSSHAVNCGCLASRKADRDKFEQYMRDIKGVTVTDPYLLEQSKELQFEFDKLKPLGFPKIITAIRFFLSRNTFKLNSRFYFDKRRKTWHINTGEVIMYDVDMEKMQKETGLVYHKWTKRWTNKQGEDIWYDECNHLVEYIKDTFNIEVKDRNWQHWNGGVFLFNDTSHEFLQAWHNKTMHIFTLPDWKTRDQGTLIATAWEFGLNNHPLLPKKFNFIADYYNNGLQINNEKELITDDGFRTTHEPAFMHVYHHWQDFTWPIWQWVAGKQQGISTNN